ncbi:centrosomal protein of 131 kDa-like [Ursus maritimus]|uniref:Centrosomal protein of 131 kDa-like n=1 Tax=Ursus maritimus TaxID=29073 RepID=A0A8M1GN42_URSMA|nr:centrosomal protein of 131 kDa-like [Ursus maritimus]
MAHAREGAGEGRGEPRQRIRDKCDTELSGWSSRRTDAAAAVRRAQGASGGGGACVCRAVLRQEFADRLAASDEETRQVRAELAKLQARQRLELEQLTREKQAELEEVHGRVKLALAKKEEAVRSLRKQHEAAVKRADHLEELLEQRRWPLPSAK